MEVYLLTREPWEDDGSQIIGVFSSFEKAKAGHPGEWKTEGAYDGAFAEFLDMVDYTLYLIKKLVVDKVTRG